MGNQHIEKCKNCDHSNQCPGNEGLGCPMTYDCCCKDANIYWYDRTITHSMKTIHVVAAIIHDDEGRIFATQRGYGDWKGWWEFPGGKIEPGENSQDAIRREVEEIGPLFADAISMENVILPKEFVEEIEKGS